jgi:signal transduction histidine kinase
MPDDQSTADLSTIVHDVLTRLDRSIRERLAVVAVAEPLGRVRGSELLLHHAVAPVLDNALKFTADAEPPHIRIWSEAGRGWIRLWIEDQGIGVPHEDRQRIFDLFERVHPESKYPGTGMGLASARKAAERLGGDIGLADDDIRGSRFWILLPAADPV